MGKGKVSSKIKTKRKKTYCICKVDKPKSEFMIGCDNCSEWYHGECIKLTKKQSDQIKKFYCANCRKKNKNLRIQYKTSSKSGVAKPPPPSSSSSSSQQQPFKRNKRQTINSAAAAANSPSSLLLLTPTKRLITQKPKSNYSDHQRQQQEGDEDEAESDYDDTIGGDEGDDEADDREPDREEYEKSVAEINEDEEDCNEKEYENGGTLSQMNEVEDELESDEAEEEKAAVAGELVRDYEDEEGSPDDAIDDDDGDGGECVDEQIMFARQQQDEHAREQLERRRKNNTFVSVEEEREEMEEQDLEAERFWASLGGANCRSPIKSGGHHHHPAPSSPSPSSLPSHSQLQSSPANKRKKTNAVISSSQLGQSASPANERQQRRRGVTNQHRSGLTNGGVPRLPSEPIERDYTSELDSTPPAPPHLDPHLSGRLRNHYDFLNNNNDQDDYDDDDDDENQHYQQHHHYQNNNQLNRFLNQQQQYNNNENLNNFNTNRSSDYVSANQNGVAQQLQNSPANQRKRKRAKTSIASAANLANRMRLDVSSSSSPSSSNHNQPPPQHYHHPQQHHQPSPTMMIMTQDNDGHNNNNIIINSSSSSIAQSHTSLLSHTTLSSQQHHHYHLNTSSIHLEQHRKISRHHQIATSNQHQQQHHHRQHHKHPFQNHHHHHLPQQQQQQQQQKRPIISAAGNHSQRHLSQHHQLPHSQSHHRHRHMSNASNQSSHRLSGITSYGATASAATTGGGIGQSDRENDSTDDEQESKGVQPSNEETFRHEPRFWTNRETLLISRTVANSSFVGPASSIACSLLDSHQQHQRHHHVQHQQQQSNELHHNLQHQSLKSLSRKSMLSGSQSEAIFGLSNASCTPHLQKSPHHTAPRIFSSSVLHHQHHVHTAAPHPTTLPHPSLHNHNHNNHHHHHHHQPQQQQFVAITSLSSSSSATSAGEYIARAPPHLSATHHVTSSPPRFCRDEDAFAQRAPKEQRTETTGRGSKAAMAGGEREGGQRVTCGECEACLRTLDCGFCFVCQLVKSGQISGSNFCCFQRQCARTQMLEMNGMLTKLTSVQSPSSPAVPVGPPAVASAASLPAEPPSVAPSCSSLHSNAATIAEMGGGGAGEENELDCATASFPRRKKSNSLSVFEQSAPTSHLQQSPSSSSSVVMEMMQEQRLQQHQESQTRLHPNNTNQDIQFSSSFSPQMTNLNHLQQQSHHSHKQSQTRQERQTTRHYRASSNEEATIGGRQSLHKVSSLPNPSSTRFRSSNNAMIRMAMPSDDATLQPSVSSPFHTNQQHFQLNQSHHQVELLNRGGHPIRSHNRSGGAFIINNAAGDAELIGGLHGRGRGVRAGSLDNFPISASASANSPSQSAPAEEDHLQTRRPGSRCSTVSLNLPPPHQQHEQQHEQQGGHAERNAGDANDDDYRLSHFYDISTTNQPISAQQRDQQSDDTMFPGGSRSPSNTSQGTASTSAFSVNQQQHNQQVQPRSLIGAPPLSGAPPVAALHLASSSNSASFPPQSHSQLHTQSLQHFSYSNRLAQTPHPLLSHHPLHRPDAPEHCSDVESVEVVQSRQRELMDDVTTVAAATSMMSSRTPTPIQHPPPHAPTHANAHTHTHTHATLHLTGVAAARRLMTQQNDATLTANQHHQRATHLSDSEELHRPPSSFSSSSINYATLPETTVNQSGSIQGKERRHPPRWSWQHSPPPHPSPASLRHQQHHPKQKQKQQSSLQRRALRNNGDVIMPVMPPKSQTQPHHKFPSTLLVASSSSSSMAATNQQPQQQQSVIAQHEQQRATQRRRNQSGSVGVAANESINSSPLITPYNLAYSDHNYCKNHRGGAARAAQQQQAAPSAPPQCCHNRDAGVDATHTNHTNDLDDVTKSVMQQADSGRNGEERLHYQQQQPQTLMFPDDLSLLEFAAASTDLMSSNVASLRNQQAGRRKVECKLEQQVQKRTGDGGRGSEDKGGERGNKMEEEEENANEEVEEEDDELRLSHFDLGIALEEPPPEFYTINENDNLEINWPFVQ